jgi:hypothetical protein
MVLALDACPSSGWTTGYFIMFFDIPQQFEI